MTGAIERQCRECGGPIQASGRAPALFCSPGCRFKFNNRRKARGAEVYDLCMEMRFARNKAHERKTWSLLCTILGRYNEDDKIAGRKTWSASSRLVNLPTSRLGR